ncbi:MAG TPA: methyltransferase domain-containing protein [Candidatus Polarisedimenticolaceae bacterium]|nr:methyltransferase domain-containing protein [Candidatus Polarisedimenticolaceae bacterium]
MSPFVFDELALQQLEVMYRSRDAGRRRSLAREALGARAGDRVLDVGCGPGFLSAELLAEVGPSGAVVGIDASAPMLAAAARRCEALGHASFHAGDATRLPVDDASFDRVICVQVLEFVPDVPAALREFHRALRPGGRVLVWDIDWSTLSWHSAEPERMRRMLQAWDRHLAHPALPRTLTTALRDAGFTDVRAEGHAFTTNVLDSETYGGLSLGIVERYLMGLDDLDREETKSWADEQRDLGRRGEYYYSVTQVCFTATRPATSE